MPFNKIREEAKDLLKDGLRVYDAVATQVGSAVEDGVEVARKLYEISKGIASEAITKLQETVQNIRPDVLSYTTGAVVTGSLAVAGWMLTARGIDLAGGVKELIDVGIYAESLLRSSNVAENFQNAGVMQAAFLIPVLSTGFTIGSVALGTEAVRLQHTTQQ